MHFFPTDATAKSTDGPLRLRQAEKARETLIHSKCTLASLKVLFMLFI